MPYEVSASRSSSNPTRAVAAPTTKTLAPGYRVGWIAGGRWHDRIVRLKFGQSLACPQLLGMAVERVAGQIKAKHIPFPGQPLALLGGLARGVAPVHVGAR